MILTSPKQIAYHQIPTRGKNSVNLIIETPDKSLNIGRIYLILNLREKPVVPKINQIEFKRFFCDVDFNHVLTRPGLFYR